MGQRQAVWNSIPFSKPLKVSRRRWRRKEEDNECRVAEYWRWRTQQLPQLSKGFLLLWSDALISLRTLVFSSTSTASFSLQSNHYPPLLLTSILFLSFLSLKILFCFLILGLIWMNCPILIRSELKLQVQFWNFI